MIGPPGPHVSLCTNSSVHMKCAYFEALPSRCGMFPSALPQPRHSLLVPTRGLLCLLLSDFFAD